MRNIIQSDIYQIGLLLFWMATGVPALDAGATYEVLRQQVGDGVPRQKAEALGTPLGDVIAKMLRRSEAHRYATAADVWHDLRQLR